MEHLIHHIRVIVALIIEQYVLLQISAALINE